MQEGYHLADLKDVTNVHHLVVLKSAYLVSCNLRATLRLFCFCYNSHSQS